MALAIFSLSRRILSKHSSLSSISIVSNCTNRSWTTLTTVKLAKQTNGLTNFPCYKLKKNIRIDSSFLYTNRIKNINNLCPLLMEQPVRFTTSTSDSSHGSPEPKLSNKDKLKRAVKEYGATVIIFHVTISLFSLGVAYLAVTSGVDMPSLLAKIGIQTNQTESISEGSRMLGSTGDVAAGVSTFVVAYAVHKVFAPVRISITLLCTPLIVRHLRKIGVLKPPKPSAA